MSSLAVIILNPSRDSISRNFRSVLVFESIINMRSVKLIALRVILDKVTKDVPSVF